MKRTPTSRVSRPVLSTLLVAAAALASPSASASPVASGAQVEKAGALYDQGLVHVGAGEWQKARSAFEQAHRLAPHAAVLLNLALVHRHLGETQRALEYLRQILATGTESPASYVQRAQALRKEWTREASPSASPSAQPSSLTDMPAVLPMALRTRPALQGAAAAAPPLAVAVDEVDNTTPAWLGIGGLTLVATAAAVWVWNDSRYRTWRQQSDDLAAYHDAETVPNEDIARDLREHRSLERSIQGFDVAAIVAGGAGLGLAGLAAWLWQRSPDDGESPELIIGPRSALYRYHF